MLTKIRSLVLLLVSVSLITFLIGIWQNQPFIKGDFAVLAEVPLVRLTSNQTSLSQPSFSLQDKILQRKTWKLVFSDNFNRANLNLSK